MIFSVFEPDPEYLDEYLFGRRDEVVDAAAEEVDDDTAAAAAAAAANAVDDEVTVLSIPLWLESSYK